MTLFGGLFLREISIKFGIPNCVINKTRQQHFFIFSNCLLFPFFQICLKKKYWLYFRTSYDNYGNNRFNRRTATAYCRRV